MLTRNLSIIILLILKTQVFGQRLPSLNYIKDTTRYETTKHIYCFKCQTDSFLFLNTKEDYLKVKAFLVPHCEEKFHSYTKTLLRPIKKFQNLNELFLSVEPISAMHGRQIDKKLWKYFLSNPRVKCIHIEYPIYFKDFIEFCRKNRPEIKIVETVVDTD